MLEHKEAISPDQNDPLHEILDDLGEVPDVESLLGNVYLYYASFFKIQRFHGGDFPCSFWGALFPPFVLAMS